MSLFARSKRSGCDLICQKIKIFKIFDQNDIGSLPRIFLSGLVVLFFYSMPYVISMNSSEVYENNSKTVLAYTLNNKTEGKIDSGTLDERDLLVDIFNLNDLETDTVRLNASTIKQLFDDTNYSLNDVRKKLVNQ